MRAWFAGEFEQCLDICAGIRPRGSQARVHLALLRARALLRLDESEAALHVLRDAAAIPCGADEAASLQMLLGAAHVRRGEVEVGRRILLSAQEHAHGVHRTIGSEIALNVALAHFARGEMSAADAALDGVGEDADIIYARSLEYRGWIASSRARFDTAVIMFRRALETLDRCAHYDRFLEANCIRALAHLGLERLDQTVWRATADRSNRMNWNAAGLVQPRFWVAYCTAAHDAEVDGNTVSAARHARASERIAPNSALRVMALCKRASVARCAGEQVSQRDHVEAALESFTAEVIRGLSGDDVVVPLVLAEELAHAHRTEDAGTALDTARAQAQPPAVLCNSHFSANSAYGHLVEAFVREECGDRRTAARLYREALSAYAKIGYTRRAVMAALHLARLTGDHDALEYAIRATAHLPAHAWLRREVERTKRGRVRLTSVQREVLMLICEGKSNPEIARLRKRSLHTVRNLVARLFEIFEVTSREQLAVECVRRGLYAAQNAS